MSTRSYPHACTRRGPKTGGILSRNMPLQRLAVVRNNLEKDDCSFASASAESRCAVVFGPRTCAFLPRCLEPIGNYDPAHITHSAQRLPRMVLRHFGRYARWEEFPHQCWRALQLWRRDPVDDAQEGKKIGVFLDKSISPRGTCALQYYLCMSQE